MTDWRGIVVFATLLGLAGLFFIVLSVYQRKEERILDDRGVQVVGTVQYGEVEIDTDQSGRSGQQRRASYSLHVTYPVGRGKWDHRFPVSKSTYRSHPFNSTVDVIYDPENPDLARLAGDLNTDQSGMSLVVGIGALCGTSALLVWARAVYNAERNDVPDLDETIRRARRGR